MSVCDHCKYRYSWDCEDGWTPKHGCNDFSLDFETLTNKQKKAIRRILIRQYDERWQNE